MAICGQSEVSENGPKWIPMAQNLGINIKIKSLGCTEPKLHIRPFYVNFNGQNGHFGHSGQSEVSENGPKWFPMAQNLGIDIKIKSLGYSEPKLQIWPF